MPASKVLVVFIVFFVFIVGTILIYTHTKGYTNKELTKLTASKMQKAKSICEDRNLIFVSLELNNTKNMHAVCVNKNPFSIQKLRVK